LVSNLEDRRLFGRHSYKWKDNIEMYLGEIVSESAECIHLALNEHH
jgi:hypothetical protein